MAKRKSDWVSQTVYPPDNKKHRDVLTKQVVDSVIDLHNYDIEQHKNEHSKYVKNN